jgi:hypothetical protein
VQLFEARRAMFQGQYDACATVIQKMWRGYYSRKHIHDFYMRKAYLHALTLKNEEVRFVSASVLSLLQNSGRHYLWAVSCQLYFVFCVVIAFAK